MPWEYGELVRLTREALQDEREAAAFYDRLLREVYRYDTVQALAKPGTTSASTPFCCRISCAN